MLQYLIDIENLFTASYKPYVIAAMIFLSKVKDPQEVLAKLEEAKKDRQVK